MPRDEEHHARDESDDDHDDDDDDDDLEEDDDVEEEEGSDSNETGTNPMQHTVRSKSSMEWTRRASAAAADVSGSRPMSRISSKASSSTQQQRRRDNKGVLKALMKATAGGGGGADDTDDDEVVSLHRPAHAQRRGSSAHADDDGVMEEVAVFGGGQVTDGLLGAGGYLGGVHAAGRDTPTSHRSSRSDRGDGGSQAGGSRRQSMNTSHGRSGRPLGHGQSLSLSTSRASPPHPVHVDEDTTMLSSPSQSPKGSGAGSARPSLLGGKGRLGSAGFKDITNTRRMSGTARKGSLQTSGKSWAALDGGDGRAPTPKGFERVRSFGGGRRRHSFISGTSPIRERMPAGAGGVEEQPHAAEQAGAPMGGLPTQSSRGSFFTGATPASSLPGSPRGSPKGVAGPGVDYPGDRPGRISDAGFGFAPTPRAEKKALTAALSAQRDPGQTAQGSVEVLRLIVHALHVRGKADLVNTIRKEALHKNIQLMIPPQVKIAGRGTPNPVHETELYGRYQAALRYLPPHDPQWTDYKAWPTQNYRKDIILLKPCCLKSDDPSAGRWVALPTLIDHLFLDRQHKKDYPFRVPIQHNFTQVFFTMYPEFVGPVELFTDMARFYLDIPDAFLTTSRGLDVRLRVLKCMGCWIRWCLHDLTESLLLRARGFVHEVLRRSRQRGVTAIEETGQWLLRIIEQSLAKELPRVPPPVRQPVEDEPESKTQGLYNTQTLGSIQGLCDEEVARQLCLVAHEDFAKISTREFLNCAWARGCDLWPMSVNLRGFNERQSDLCDWVASQIIAGATPEERVTQLRQFIRVGYHCLVMNNLSVAQAIHSGVVHRAVRRLKQTVGTPPFSLLPTTTPDDGTPSEAQQYEQLDELCDYFKQETRRRLTAEAIASNVPCIPILANVQRHITVAQEMGDSVLVRPDAHDYGTTIFINWQKILGMADVLMPVLTLQSRPYSFQPIPKLLKILTQMPGRQTADTLDKESQAREPDEPKPPMVPRVAFTTPSTAPLAAPKTMRRKSSGIFGR